MAGPATTSPPEAGPPDIDATGAPVGTPADVPAGIPAGAPQPRLGLVIFDCDGVLIDSEIVVCRLTAEELSRLGYAVTTEQVIERFAGRPEREMVAEIERDWGRPVPPAYFANMRRRTEAAYRDELAVMPGVADALARMRVARCVASSSDPAKLALGLRAVGLHEHFAPHIISATAVAHGKPAPDVFIYAAGWMRRGTAECLVIEDSVPGVRAAVAAGMRVLGFTGGSHCRVGHAERLLGAGAERVFADFRELEEVLPGAFAEDNPIMTEPKRQSGLAAGVAEASRGPELTVCGGAGQGEGAAAEPVDALQAF